MNRLSTPSSVRGFTLMEMLIVLSIIALLMGMVIFNLGDVTGVAKRQKAESDLLTFKELLAVYQLQTGSLPTTEQGIKALWEKPTAEPVPDHWKMLLDHEVKDPWNHPYQYENPGKHNPDRYDVYSEAEDGQPGTPDDIGNWSTTNK